MQRRVEKSPRDPHHAERLTADPSPCGDLAQKSGLSRARKLNGGQKSRRARALAQERWNALHGKGPASCRSRPRR
jgi:hypothetical protein